MEYLDFELRIAPGAGRDYPVSVLRSPAGEASGTMRFPFDTLALQSRLQLLQIALLRSGGVRRDVMSDEQQSVVQFGQQLFEALMTDAVRESFRRSQDRARSAGRGLRLRLRIEAPELAALPWEYLYDPSDGDYVCLSTDTPVVRYLELDRPPEPVAVQPPLSILGMIVSPSDRVALDVQHEKERVEAATTALRAAGLLKLTWLEGSTWRDLQKAMRQGPFHIFHFVGHGGFDSASREGVVALADGAGQTALLTATQLGRLLADHQSLRLVVLNSCLGAKGSGTDIFSSTASILVRRGVPAVIAMQYEISDDAAVEFARSLYEALADEMPVDAAVAEARKAISLSVTNTVEWGTPVLYMRSPDGVLFRIKGMTPSVARASGRLSGGAGAPGETSPEEAHRQAAAAETKRAAEAAEERRRAEAAAKAQRQAAAQATRAAEQAEQRRQTEVSAEAKRPADELGARKQGAGATPRKGGGAERRPADAPTHGVLRRLVFGVLYATVGFLAGVVLENGAVAFFATLVGLAVGVIWPRRARVSEETGRGAEQAARARTDTDSFRALVRMQMIVLVAGMVAMWIGSWALGRLGGSDGMFMGASFSAPPVLYWYFLSITGVAIGWLSFRRRRWIGVLFACAGPAILLWTAMTVDAGRLGEDLVVLVIGGAVISTLSLRGWRDRTRIPLPLVVIHVLGVLLAMAVILGQAPRGIPLHWIWTVLMSSGAALAILGLHRGIRPVAVLGWSTALLNAPDLYWFAFLFLNRGVMIVYALYGALCVYLFVRALRVMGDRRKAVAADATPLRDS